MVVYGTNIVSKSSGAIGTTWFVLKLRDGLRFYGELLSILKAVSMNELLFELIVSSLFRGIYFSREVSTVSRFTGYD